MLFTLPLLCAAQPDRMKVGSVDFFGTVGIDVAAVRRALPFAPGDTIREADLPALKQQIETAVTKIAGAAPTDISATCCGSGGGLMIYIGLPGQNSRPMAHLAAPTGSACLPASAVKLYTDTIQAMAQAVRAGDAAEDHDQGYALSHNPALRERQVAMRKFAAGHASLIEHALADCSQAENRQAAAHLLGYANRSPQQIAALVRASNDPDATVRNNAVRALWVLAQSSKQAARMVPAAPFVAMLNSGNWEDRNKAGLLLSALSETRDPQLLAKLRAEALDSLVEMARWQNLGHAGAYREILGRIGGLDESRIHQLVSSGDVEALIAAAKGRP